MISSTQHVFFSYTIEWSENVYDTFDIYRHISDEIEIKYLIIFYLMFKI